MDLWSLNRGSVYEGETPWCDLWAIQQDGNVSSLIESRETMKRECCEDDNCLVWFVYEILLMQPRVEHVNPINDPRKVSLGWLAFDMKLLRIWWKHEAHPRVFNWFMPACMVSFFMFFMVIIIYYYSYYSDINYSAA